MSGTKIILPVCLLSVLSVEAMVNLDSLHSKNSKEYRDSGYISQSVLDNKFPRASLAKYQNVVSDGVLGELEKAESSNHKAETINLSSNKLELRGITITPERKFAILLDKQKGKSVIAQEGDVVNSINLVEIMTDRVVLHKNNQNYELVLRKSKDKNQ